MCFLIKAIPSPTTYFQLRSGLFNLFLLLLLLLLSAFTINPDVSN